MEKAHPVDPFTKEQHVVRDTLRDTALKSSIEQGEALTQEQAERIRQESDLAARAEPKPEFREQFANQVIQQYGQAALSLSGEQLNQLIENYCQQNQGACKTTIGQETDLVKMGQELLDKASVTEHVQAQIDAKEAEAQGGAGGAGGGAQEPSEEEILQEIVDSCQPGSPVVQITESANYDGWYDCRAGKKGKKLTPQEASRLKKSFELIEIKEAQLKKLEERNQDTTPATFVSPSEIEEMGRLLDTMAAEYRQRQLEDPFLDTDSDGYLNYLDCDPSNQIYQKSCPGQTGRPLEYSVYTVADNLQVKGILTFNGQPVMGNVVLEVYNPKTGKYEAIEVEFDRWGQFTSDSFSTFIGPMADPVLISATVIIDGQPRRVVVPINPNEDGTFSIQNVRLEDYNVGTEEELIKQINDKYGLEIQNGPNPGDRWTAQELRLIEETLSELPPIFWAKESFTGFSRGAGRGFEKEVAAYVPESLLISATSRAFGFGLEANVINIFNDNALSLNQRTFPKPSTSYNQEALFKQVLIHELTHTIQHQNPVAYPRPFTPILPNPYENLLVQSYMETIGWQ
ncbi:hypothetical protein MUP59_09860, partial [Candidatus Bathyarchaeota archaeon]|nr:hypothetical protein [Candidatus Bathyarchaeota archaeon]